MAEQKGRPPGRAETKDEPGRLEQDDRGNVTWQWSDNEQLQADDTLGGAERLRALVDPRLNIEPEHADPMSPIGENPVGLKQGYNPYNSGTLGKQSWKKKKDLRKLSEWIALKKKVADKPEGE